MKQYAEITDKGECYSSLSLCIEGVNANATEWSKHNFYPQNGMVGEIVEIYNPYTYILKIQDTIYVPISPKGFKKISETEFNRRVSNNSYTGMDEKQQRINREEKPVLDENGNQVYYDSGKMQGKPKFAVKHNRRKENLSLYLIESPVPLRNASRTKKHWSLPQRYVRSVSRNLKKVCWAIG